MAVPRRNIVSEMKPAELAIREAINEIEMLGADIELTNAINLIHQASNKVSDYIDSQD